MVEIPLSKKKLILLFLGALIFVVLGVWFITSPVTFMDTGYRNRPKLEIEIVGYACIIFFGACAIVGAYKLFDNKLGLIIDENGITDNSSGVSLGFVKWDDISGTGVKQIGRQRFLLIYIKNADHYIDEQSNWLKKKMIVMNYKMYKTPITISSNGLKCNFDEMVGLINKNIEAHK